LEAGFEKLNKENPLAKNLLNESKNTVRQSSLEAGFEKLNKEKSLAKNLSSGGGIDAALTEIELNEKAKRPNRLPKIFSNIPMTIIAKIRKWQINVHVMLLLRAVFFLLILVLGRHLLK
jgi:hypothetical protein